MNEPIRKTPPPTGRAGGSRWPCSAPCCSIGVALYASRSSLPPAPADDPKDKKPAAATPHAVAAANAFLDALDAKQREKALYEFGSPQKSNWSNLPVTFVPRNGVRLGDLTKEQRALAMEVVAAVLSKGGYQKVVDIMDGDQQLAEGGRQGQGRQGQGRQGPEGRCSAPTSITWRSSASRPRRKPWMVQFGGHHLGLNVTVIGKHFVLTPTHTGAQPTLFKRDGKEVRPLGLENDTAFKLVNALDDKQRAQAIIGGATATGVVAGAGARRQEDRAGGDQRLRADRRPAGDAAGRDRRLGEHRGARRGRGADGGDQGQDRRDVLRLERADHQGQRGLLPRAGADRGIEYARRAAPIHIHTVVRNPKDDYGAERLER